MQNYPSIEPVTVDFHGNQLITVEQDGIIYVAMKPICEGMGLDWGGQQKKLVKQMDKFNCRHMSIVAADGKLREMLCIPLTKLNGWLFSINPMKVKVGIRLTVELYQEECFVALYDYWHKGVAVNPRAAALPEKHMTAGFLRKETEEAIGLAGLFGMTGNQARLSANMFVRQLHDIDCMEFLGITHLISDDTELHLTPSDIGKELGYSAREANKRLTESGLQTSFRDAKKRIHYEPTEKGIPFSVFKDTGKKRSDGTPVRQLFWKKSVISVLKKQNLDKSIE